MNFRLRKAESQDIPQIEKLIADSVRGLSAVGCGGWSWRKTLYGASDYAHSRDSNELDPNTDAAKIRAFFIHPDWARKGIGKTILNACEDEARSFGFKTAEMMSTLPGIKLYTACGYAGEESVGVPVGEEVEIECVRMSKEI